MVSAIPAIIGAGASLLGGFINNQYAQARSDQQWDRMNYMQDKMNAYNSPTAQMARLRAAGLNPNLVYANGGAVIQSAVGNAPNPPNTAPIDTQGVLQMVQTIVGAMLEKDKIQANKEMQTQSIKSQEQMHEASIQSQEGMQEKSIQSQEGMQEKSIQSQERIEFAKLSESARQADMRNAIDRAHVAIDQYMAQIAKYRADTDAMESYSRKALNEQQYRFHESLDQLELSIKRGEIREYQIRNGIAEVENFLSRPGPIDKRQLSVIYDKYDIPYTDAQLDHIQYVFENMHQRLDYSSTYRNNRVGAYIEAFWDSMFKPVAVIGSNITK